VGLSILLASALTTLVLLSTCGHSEKRQDNTEISGEPNDTLRVATLYSPTSYFLYREEPMGYDYELVKRFAEDTKRVLDLKVATNVNEMLSLLSSGEVDLIAYDVPVTAAFNKDVLHCGFERVSYQVLVQPKGEHQIHDVTELQGKTVYVERDSKYHHRLGNLNDEIGGGIVIKPISKDTLIADDMIEMVSSGKIPLTVVDSDIASINKTYYPDLDISMKISLDQKGSWGVRRNEDNLAESIDEWIKREDIISLREDLHKKYFEQSKNPLLENPDDNLLEYGRSKGSLSPYDAIFKKHAADTGADWRLLVAVGYVESHFMNNIVSWAGAKGVMQIMPITARAYGVSTDLLSNPDVNIKVGAKLLQTLDKSFKNKVKNQNERLKFVLAAYNSGIAHVLDAMALAEKHGYDSSRWEGNVRETLTLKSHPEYYNDPVVKYGYFRATETVEFVDKVQKAYSHYRTKAAL
jgi:membrane-bound lytic murein transglycosylase F